MIERRRMNPDRLRALKASYAERHGSPEDNVIHDLLCHIEHVEPLAMAPDRNHQTKVRSHR